MRRNLPRTVTRYFSFIALIPFLSPVAAQEVHLPDVREVRDIQHPIRTDVSLVLVPVIVTDRRGATVTSLAQEDFTLLDNKVPQPIVSFHAQDAPTSVGIVLDTSESMRNVLRMAKEVLHAFLESANPQDDLFLMTVSSKPQILSSVTDDPEELESAIRSARAGGNTALIDTIRLAAEHIRKARNAQRALLIVSDGIDNRSRFSKTELLHTVVEIDAQIHTITFETTTPNRKPVEQVEEHRGLRFMDDLAERTGGVNFVVRSGSEAVDAAAKVARALRSQYVIGFRPADMDTSGKWHRIQIQVKLHDTHVSARNGYYAR